jgi:hypothetical protein
VNPFIASNGAQDAASLFPRPEGATTSPVQTATSNYMDIAMGIVKGDWNGLGDH